MKRVMKNNTTSDLILAGILLSFLIGLLIGWARGENKTQAKVAQTECARYHPETGRFEWLKEQE
jgi:hypothetical protein